MIALFAILSLLFNAQILVTGSQSMPKDYDLKSNLFKRTEEGRAREVFDKDLKVHYLPSETEIAKSGHSKLPVKKAKVIDQIESMAVRLEASSDVLPLNYEYHPRKKASEYSQSSRARKKLEKMENMRKNDPRKYAEYLTKTKDRKKNYSERLKDDPNARIRAKQYSKTRAKNVHLLRYKDRMGIADEVESRRVARIRKRERDKKAKIAKNKKAG